MSSAGDRDRERIRKLQLARLDPPEPDEAVMPIEQSLHSIAVELARGNAIAHEALALQEKSVLLGANYLDLCRIGAQAATSGPGGEAAKSLERVMELLMGAAVKQAERPAELRSTTGDGKTLPVETQAAGTRTTAQPPDAPSSE